MPRKSINIIGQRYGRLTVISYSRKTLWNNGSIKHLWLCQCDCGNLKEVSTTALKSGTRSCGCYKKEQLLLPRPDRKGLGNFNDLTGRKFGRLLILKRDVDIGKYVAWLCRCDCGNEKVITSSSLVTGNTQSCGCLQSEVRSKNGLKRRHSFGESMFMHVYNEYRKSAKKRGYEFKLTESEFKEIIIKPCSYCGRPAYTIRSFGGNYGDFLFTGIDRQDNNIGYTVKNSIPCCFICNRAKGTLTVDEFFSWVKDISKNFRLNNSTGIGVFI